VNRDEEWPIEVADDVIVWGGGRSHSTGVVKAIGPKHIHVIMPYGKIVRFLRDTRQRTDGNPGSIETLPQNADREARAEYRQVLRNHGIEMGFAEGWTTKQLHELVIHVKALHVMPAKESS
jgi:hypothetical protein